MTPLQTLCHFLETAEIVYTYIRADDSRGTDLNPQSIKIRVEAGRNAGNTGYTGFFTDFVFDRDTEILQSVGAWE